jgi:hypothetical protein
LQLSRCPVELHVGAKIKDRRDNLAQLLTRAATVNETVRPSIDFVHVAVNITVGGQWLPCERKYTLHEIPLFLLA